MKIRRMLTEILLEVTDQEIDVVANEVLEEEKSKKHQWVQSFTCTFVHYSITIVHNNSFFGLRLPTFAYFYKYLTMS